MCFLYLIGDTELLTLLLCYKCDPQPGFVFALRRNHLEVCRLLLEHGAVLKRDELVALKRAQYSIKQLCGPYRVMK